jgi:transposase
VLDNLREGVLKPDIYDPTIHPVYADMLRHYGVVAMPCRVADPDRKGKVESGVGHAQKTPLKGMRFESPQEAQAYLDHWEAHWADTRIHARPNGRSRPCLPKSGRPCYRCPSSPSVITNTANGPCTWTAA